MSSIPCEITLSVTIAFNHGLAEFVYTPGPIARLQCIWCSSYAVSFIREILSKILNIFHCILVDRNSLTIQSTYTGGYTSMPCPTLRNCTCNLPKELEQMTTTYSEFLQLISFIYFPTPTPSPVALVSESGSISRLGNSFNLSSGEPAAHCPISLPILSLLITPLLGLANPSNPLLTEHFTSMHQGKMYDHEY